MGEQQGKMGYFALVRQPVEEKENDFKTSVFCF